MEFCASALKDRKQNGNFITEKPGLSNFVLFCSCSCDGGYDCVLTDNRPDMDMYMFHCRQKDRSGHMFKFPNSRGWSLFLLPWQKTHLHHPTESFCLSTHSTQHVSLHYTTKNATFLYKKRIGKMTTYIWDSSNEKKWENASQQWSAISDSKYILQLSSQLLLFSYKRPLRKIL